MKFNRHQFLANTITIPRREFFRLAASAVAFPSLSRRALALDYPTRPVRFISGFLAGGPVDIATRVMADWFSSDLGQQFVVEDRGGMGGNLRRPNDDQFAAGRLYASARGGQQRHQRLAL
jgi:tripartite-type tricarboxylate transporter receptor subunit TctC